MESEILSVHLSYSGTLKFIGLSCIFGWIFYSCMISEHHDLVIWYIINSLSSAHILSTDMFHYVIPKTTFVEITASLIRKVSYMLGCCQAQDRKYVCQTPISSLKSQGSLAMWSLATSTVKLFSRLTVFSFEEVSAWMRVICLEIVLWSKVGVPWREVKVLVT